MERVENIHPYIAWHGMASHRIIHRHNIKYTFVTSQNEMNTAMLVEKEGKEQCE